MSLKNIKDTMWAVFVMLAVVVPFVALAQATGTTLPPGFEEPGSFGDAAGMLKLVVSLWKTGSWIGVAVAVSQIGIFLVKQLDNYRPTFKKYGTAIILVLSAVVGLMGFVVGGMKWPEAVVLFLGTLAPKILADLLTELGFTPHRDDPPATPAAVVPPTNPPAA